MRNLFHCPLLLKSKKKEKKSDMESDDNTIDICSLVNFLRFSASALLYNSISNDILIAVQTAKTYNHCTYVFEE